MENPTDRWRREQAERLRSEEARKAQDESDRAKVEKILKERGIRLNVAACGCCGSPWITIEIDGQVVLNSEMLHIEMIP